MAAETKMEFEEVRIVDIAFGGEGVGRTDAGKTVFVPDAAIGDVLRVRLLSQHGRYARGEIAEIRSAGPGRQAPVCRYFGRCGGCAYQHLTYEQEWRAKQRQLIELLKRIGRMPGAPGVDTAVPAPTVCGYRNKLRLHPLRSADSGGARADRLEYGYYARDNTTLFPVHECALARPELQDLLSNLPDSVVHPRKRGARPKPLTLRAAADGSVAWYTGKPPADAPDLPELLFGKTVFVPLGSFWQVYPEMADKLFHTVSEWFSEAPTRNLIDAYSGVGAFSLAIGEAARRAFLIERDRRAFHAARRNYRDWFGRAPDGRVGPVETLLPALLAATNRRRTTVLLDPPRSGCSPAVLQALAAKPPRRIIYVSCNAATLARDLRGLLEGAGYAVQRLGLFDMFPRTPHFETVAVLGRG